MNKENINIEIEGFEDVVFDAKVLRGVRCLQHPETVDYYASLLDRAIDAAIDNDEYYSDEEALELIRGLNGLRKALYRLLPEMNVDDAAKAHEETEAFEEKEAGWEE